MSDFDIREDAKILLNDHFSRRLIPSEKLTEARVWCEHWIDQQSVSETTNTDSLAYLAMSAWCERFPAVLLNR